MGVMDAPGAPYWPQTAAVQVCQSGSNLQHGRNRHESGSRIWENSTENSRKNSRPKTEKKLGPDRQNRTKAAENAAELEEQSEEGRQEKETKERESRKKGRRAQWRGREGG